MGAYSRLSVVVAVCGLVTGGCAQIWDDIAEALWRADSAGDIQKEDIAVLSDTTLTDFVTAAGPAPEKRENPAARYMDSLGQEVVSVLSDVTLSEERRMARFRELLTQNLDIPVIARFALGRYWNKSSVEQRKDYLRAFTGFVVKTYAMRLGGIEVDRMDILGTNPVGKKDVLVRCEVSRAEKKPVRANWRMREIAGTFRILDLSVEGISMAMTLRHEFASVLGRRGIGSLIELLKKRAA
ncbi:MAG: ABC transporter substrate-binding protein [Rhodospirillales bacterium]|jgi:phospholipid transport system substrate-binding protein|nr:ABC transporter substrate-binding protein [Rhodospirillales bacterium]MDP6773387.1 ABC transporter substrate-binding protein [Rhodospirillales bacterium]